MSGKPFPKSSQLRRGDRRYRRVIASPKQWQDLRAAKTGSCRVCKRKRGGSLHHLIPRDFHGDDVEENLVPLCLDCHLCVTLREPKSCRALLRSLTPAEYDYAVGRMQNAFERLYGVRYARP